MYCKSTCECRRSTHHLQTHDVADTMTSSTQRQVVDDAHIERVATLSFEQVAPGHAAYLRDLKRSGFEPRVVYDIGACVLHWTTFARTLWPDARYYAFDAFDRAEFLYKRAGVEYHMGVLSDRDGREVEFYQNDAQPGGNSYYREIGCGHMSDALFPSDRRAP